MRASILPVLLVLGGTVIAVAADTTYATWAREHFDGDVDDPAKEATVWGTNADPDRDGRFNLMEYALGNDPKSGADASAGIDVGLQPATDGGTERYLHATVTQRTTDPGLQFLPQVSGDGQVWDEGQDHVEAIPQEVIQIDPPPPFRLVIYRDRTATEPDHPRFFRLKVAITDTDSDGLPDDWELKYFGDLAQTATGDPDRDELTNLQELSAGTNPTLADTEGDGMPDGWEVTNMLNPLVDDAHAPSAVPGLDNITAYIQGRNPAKGQIADTTGTAVGLTLFTPLE